jgi:uncharacterized membrane protein
MDDNNASAARPIDRTAPQPDKITELASRLVIGFARHWLFIFNLAWAIYVGLPLLAPLLMQSGAALPARLIYRLYSFFCHQLPNHSYFLFGLKLTPLQADLLQGGMPAGLGLFQERAFIGNHLLGYKVAICQRDIAIYGSILLAGLLYGLVRNCLQPPSFKFYLLLLVPLALDGLTQLAGWRESNWQLRTLTGALFGMASVWLAYPFLHSAMQDVVKSETMHREQ